MNASQLAMLAHHAQRLRNTRTLELFAADAQRAAQFSVSVGPLLYDFSRQKLDSAAVADLGKLAHERGLDSARTALFRGDPVNTSEHRAALHTALRGCSVAPAAIRAEVADTLTRMQALVEAIHADAGAGFDLPDSITDVVNLGIGGSDLGPRLACEALSDFHIGKIRPHFLPNVDAAQTSALMHALDPRRTLVLLVSKSFTTQETLLNGGVLRRWIANAYGGDETAAARHLVAVSANVAAAQAFGVARERILPMWDWVGGRYSVWSASGLVLALSVGMPRFREFLSGAAAIDEHFQGAPWHQNLPLLQALIGVWNRNALGLPTQAVIAYDDRLRELPAYLQQLEMESLGKAVASDGSPVAQATVPVVWGSVGTNAQHAFFQALHQGTDIVPVDFIGVIRPAHDLRDNQSALLANLLAQSAALMHGKSYEQALAELDDVLLGDAERTALAAQCTFPGDRPSSTLLLDELTPASLGALLASYEHKVFAQSVIWGINAFDQCGVELGKQIAKKILPALCGDADVAAFDGSTRALIETIRAKR